MDGNPQAPISDSMGVMRAASESRSSFSIVDPRDDRPMAADEAIRLDRVRHRLHALLAALPGPGLAPIAGEFEA
jgi:hypothetical protein